MTPEEQETVEFIQTVFGDVWPAIYFNVSYPQCRAILAAAKKIKGTCRQPCRIDPPPVNRLQWN